MLCDVRVAGGAILAALASRTLSLASGMMRRQSYRALPHTTEEVAPGRVAASALYALAFPALSIKCWSSRLHTLHALATTAAGLTQPPWERAEEMK